MLFESVAPEVAIVSENECTHENISGSTATSAKLRSRSLQELLETSHQGSAWSGEGGLDVKCFVFHFRVRFNLNVLVEPYCLFTSD